MPKSDKKVLTHKTPRNNPAYRQGKKDVVIATEVEDLDDNNGSFGDIGNQHPVFQFPEPTLADIFQDPGNLKDVNGKHSKVIEDPGFQEHGDAQYDKMDFNDDAAPSSLQVGMEVEVVSSPGIHTADSPSYMMNGTDPFLGDNNYNETMPLKPEDVNVLDIPFGGGTPGPYYSYTEYMTGGISFINQQVCQEDSFSVNNTLGFDQSLDKNVGELVQTLEKVCPSILDEAMHEEMHVGEDSYWSESKLSKDEGFDEIHDMKAPVIFKAGRKRQHAEDAAPVGIPSVVADFEPKVEDPEFVESVVAERTTEGPNNSQVLFLNRGKTFTTSCSPETTGQDLKRIAKLHGNLLGLNSEDDLMLMAAGRHVQNDDLVTTDMMIDIVELPVMKKRKGDLRKSY